MLQKILRNCLKKSQEKSSKNELNARPTKLFQSLTARENFTVTLDKVMDDFGLIQTLN